MDLQEVLDKLEEAKEEKNWDLVQEAIEQLIEMNLDNPFDGYNGEDWGWHGFDRCYLKIECSGDWVGLVTKDS